MSLSKWKAVKRRLRSKSTIEDRKGARGPLFLNITQRTAQRTLAEESGVEYG